MGKARSFGRGAALVMGMAFAFGWTPCVGPILGSILAIAGTTGSVAQGVLLLLALLAGPRGTLHPHRAAVRHAHDDAELAQPQLADHQPGRRSPAHDRRRAHLHRPAGRAWPRGSRRCCLPSRSSRLLRAGARHCAVPSWYDMHRGRSIDSDGGHMPDRGPRTSIATSIMWLVLLVVGISVTTIGVASLGGVFNLARDQAEPISVLQPMTAESAIVARLDEAARALDSARSHRPRSCGGRDRPSAPGSRVRTRCGVC